jgi:diaminohydroxyphosphoribosylaminopyrimidine deaminase/5-amino-6-(5-phosphoribosylamino)uracil reductase
MDHHKSFMDRALELAQRGGRAVAPNPMVGAVIVHDGKIIGEGYHHRFGEPHAEVHAIESVEQRELLLHSTLYVTLEPCSHFGKTPPCADLIIASGIRHVVVGCRDPFPQVSGRGIAKLQNAGITVTENVRRDACTFVNRRFVTRHAERRPYIILKWAQTQDGFIAPLPLQRYAISGEESHRLVHAWRAEEMGILIGRRTAEIDDPLLTVRLVSGENPTRIVIDPSLSLNAELNTFNAEAQTIVINTQRSGSQGSVRRLLIPKDRWSTQEICSALAHEGLTSVLVEGGAHTLATFIESGLWDEARIFTAPSLLKEGCRAPSITGLSSSREFVGTDSLQHLYNPILMQRLGISDFSILKTVAPLNHAVGE